MSDSSITLRCMVVADMCTTKISKIKAYRKNARARHIRERTEYLNGPRFYDGLLRLIGRSRRKLTEDQVLCVMVLSRFDNPDARVEHLAGRQEDVCNQLHAMAIYASSRGSYEMQLSRTDFDWIRSND